MRFLRTPPAAALFVLAGVMALAACAKSKNSNPTNPGPLEMNSGNLLPSAQYEHRFFAAGLYPYHCSIHTTMTGSINVSDTGTDTVSTVSIVGIPAMAFSPVAVTIHTGGKVTWTNNDAITTHTVTSD